MAPFTPFFAEYLFQQLTTSPTPDVKNPQHRVSGDSVHLEAWSRAGKIDTEVLRNMEEVRKIVSLGLEARAKANIKVRQPLAKLQIRNPKSEILNKSELSNLIKEEINVQEIEINPNIQNEAELDTTLTPELKDEGQFRELVRFVQEMRKKLGFKAGEFAVLSVGATGASRRFIEQHEQELSHIASLKNIVIADSVEGVPASSAGAEPFQADEILLTLLLQKA